MRREKRDATRGSPRSFAAQKALAQDDNRTAPLSQINDGLMRSTR